MKLKLLIGLTILTLSQSICSENKIKVKTIGIKKKEIVKKSEIIKTNVEDSLILEGKSAMFRGVNFLLGKQAKDGSWLQHPAITALTVLAIANSPEAKSPEALKSIENGMSFVIKFVQADGSIWEKSSKDYPNYSTSVCLVTFAYLNKPEYSEIIKNAREFLKSSQFTDGSPKDNPSYGGIGYGKNLRPDLSNTQYALEALYLTENFDNENSDAMKKNAEMWKRAQVFLSRCQSLAATNDQAWVVDDPENNGSFIYLPENKESKAGEMTVKGGKTTLRGYGSMTYAGLKSMIYAKMEKDDVRVKAAYDWAMKNYTLDENPGMQLQGLYYYINTFSKALAIMGNDEVKTADGKIHNWKEDIAKKLISVQKGDGSWINTEGRWFENISELVTAYSLLALEEALGQDIQQIMRKQE